MMRGSERQSLGGINQRPKDKRHLKTRATPVSHFTQKIRETTCACHRIIVMTNTTNDWRYSNWKITASGHKLPPTVGEQIHFSKWACKHSIEMKVPEMHTPLPRVVILTLCVVLIICDRLGFARR